MFVPIPVLIVIGAIFILLLALALRPSRGRDPLLGGQPSAYRPLPTRRESPATAPVTVLPPEVEAEVRALLAAGRKIDAIKLAREVTHLGLKDTKDLVEALE
ncbi:large subunit ribosomal protein L7/L12 [Sphingomonas sp. UYAg733]